MAIHIQHKMNITIHTPPRPKISYLCQTTPGDLRHAATRYPCMRWRFGNHVHWL
uniref:Uncharacterized protein n=1 Tax=Ulva partita TaxID=1605170 RepID=A0A1C9ZW24_9CHLO|nr:hypothetical protein [Ulva partita]